VWLAAVRLPIRSTSSRLVKASVLYCTELWKSADACCACGYRELLGRHSSYESWFAVDRKLFVARVRSGLRTILMTDIAINTIFSPNRLRGSLFHITPQRSIPVNVERD
jgi:hypothetical protein